jgi:4-aminobutyrate aminotransferase
MTASRAVQRRGFGPVTTPGVFHAPYPDVYRAPKGSAPAEVAAESIAWIEERLFVNLVPPDEVAAIVVEPIQGEGGYIVPPIEFHQQLAALAKKHGILIVADEVQSGMGRTGRMFASEHFDLRPDIVTMAKGIASGLPLGVTAARADVMDWTPGAHASTFGGNPVACAAALATIDLLEHELVANAAKVGDHLLASVRALAEQQPLIGDVRGRGLMIGIELVRDRETKVRATDERDAIVDRMFAKGVLVLGAGRNAIRLCPPLVLTTEQADYCVRMLGEALTELGRR